MIRGELVQVDPAGPVLPFQMNPETLTRSGRLSRLGTVQRPGRVDTVEWEGAEPFRIDFTLRFDGWPDIPVNNQIARLEGMAGLAQPDQPPPRLRLRYSGYSPVVYVVDSLSMGPELRRPDLAIVRVDVRVGLVEWVDPDVVPDPPSVRAQRRQRTEGTALTAGRTHTVVKGDQLFALAQQLLGDGARWQEIADANQIVDPRSIVPGQVLSIPDR